MKESHPRTRNSFQEAGRSRSDLEISNEIDAVAAEVIDAFEQARLVRINHRDPRVQQSMDQVRKSLTLALRHLAPFAFHAERWLGDEVEQWPE